MHRTILSAIVAVAGLGACTDDIEGSIASDVTVAATQVPETTQAPVETAGSTLSDTEIELLAIELTWPADEICPLWDDIKAQATNLAALDAVEDLAIREMEAGYGKPLTPEGRALIEDLLNDC